MSERPAGIPEGIVPDPRESAVVIVARKDAAGEWELLMGLRSRRSGFFPGNWAFPGGGVEPQDHPGRAGARARCAARELEEETGVRVRPEDLVSIGIKVTPPFHPIRYRTEFFVVPAPAKLVLPPASPSPEENEELRFLNAREALDAWERADAFFPPPLPPLLRVFARERMARFDTLPRLLAVVNEYEERVPRIEFVPWVWMYPILSPTLPPATHTNVWIAGGRRLVVVDPGGATPFDLDHLCLVIDRRVRIGGRLEAVLLTHHHRDHVAGAAHVARRYGVPVRAHAATAALLEGRLPDHEVAAGAVAGGLVAAGSVAAGDVEVAGDIEDGTVLDLGGLTLVAHHTPGHAPGHLLFEIPERKAALAGDLVSGFSSIFVPPDEGQGDMAAYMDALRRALALDVRLFLPAHGPPMPPRGVEKALAHRLLREERVAAALRDVPRPLDEIAADAYADTPGSPAVLAQAQSLAHLRKLARDGRAAPEDDGAWRALPQNPPDAIDPYAGESGDPSPA